VETEKSIALDIVKEALESLEINTEIDILDFGSVIGNIQSGDADGSAALWKNESREKYLAFSKPYLQNQLVLVGLKGSNVSIESFSEFENVRIGVVENYAYGDDIQKGHNIEIVTSASDQQNLERLISKEIDYFLVDALLIQYLLKYQLNDVREILAIGDNPMIVKPLYFAIRNDIPEAEQILTKFNEAIKTMMSDGSYNEILELNWVKADVDGDGEVELVLAGNKAGTSEPTDSYNVLYSEQGGDTEGFYVDGTKYKSWNEVPDSYKVELPPVEVQQDMNNSHMKIPF